MTDLQALHDTTHTMVMGVLNITEDSVSDGGLWPRRPSTGPT